MELICMVLSHRWLETLKTGAWTPYRRCVRCGQTEPNPNHPEIKKAAEYLDNGAMRVKPQGGLLFGDTND